MRSEPSVCMCRSLSMDCTACWLLQRHAGGHLVGEVLVHLGRVADQNDPPRPGQVHDERLVPLGVAPGVDAEQRAVLKDIERFGLRGLQER